MNNRDCHVLERLERDFDKAKRILVPNLTDWTQAGKVLARLAAFGGRPVPTRVRWSARSPTAGDPAVRRARLALRVGLGLLAAVLLGTAALVTLKLAHGMVDHYWTRGSIMCAWASVGMASRIYRRNHRTILGTTTA